MNRRDWQIFYSVTDEEMLYIEKVLRIFNGRIVSVKDKPPANLGGKQQ